ncbi:hypothetical protein GCM10027258_41040 [Amycolatopsis stemonae]
MGTQGRLRGLLHATQMVTGELDLLTLLRRIVQAARELLGVIGVGGQLVEFVHAAIGDETVARVFRRPEGRACAGRSWRRHARSGSRTSPTTGGLRGLGRAPAHAQLPGSTTETGATALSSPTTTIHRR